MIQAIRSFFQSIQAQADSYEMKVAPVQFKSVEEAYQAGCDQSMAFNVVTRGVGAVATAVTIQHTGEVLNDLV